MENYKTLQTEITEVKYLSTENTYRYRPIMRFFFRKFEQSSNWLYKEEVYEELKDKISDYTIEDLERDLSVLVDNKSLTTVQDVKNIQTLDDFKNKKFRYQITDYGVEIERLTIQLEELEVHVASLSPKRFEVLKDLIGELLDINGMSYTDFNELWKRIISEFKDLNQNYQDFLKKFQESKTEELLESVVFLEYKNKMIIYLQDFIRGYLTNGFKIRDIILSLDEDIDEKIVSKLEENQRNEFNLNLDFNYSKFNDLNRGRWTSIKRWFTQVNGMSEGDRLLEVTNQIITQITKCAANLIELHGNMITRKEEYKHLANLFDRISNINDAHKLSSTVFGVSSVVHFKGLSNLATDSLVSSYEVEPTLIDVEPVDKRMKIEKTRVIVEDKSSLKKRIIEEENRRVNREKEILLKFVNQGKVELLNEVSLEKEELDYILNLISRANNGECRENILGLSYKIEELDGKCQIVSEEGVFFMNAIRIKFDEVK